MKQSPNPDSRSTRKRATLLDWCALHRITPEQCVAWMSGAQPPTRTTKPMENTSITADQIWTWSAQAVARAMPEHADEIANDLTQIDVNTAPDRVKFPTSFTLHDSGNGRPYVSSHYGGTARDMLTLAHEFGHAIQILHTADELTPPVLREVCAFLAEGWLIDHINRFDPSLASEISAPWHRSIAADFGRRREALQTACSTPDAPYNYAWNYPLARRLALAAQVALSPAEHWELFAGRLTVAELAAKAGISH